MSIRLNKALRELDLGLQAAVEFLKKKPELGEVKAEPSFKLSDEQYKALRYAFGKDVKQEQRHHVEPPCARKIEGRYCFNLIDTIQWLNISWQEAIKCLYPNDSIENHTYNSDVVIESFEFAKLTRTYHNDENDRSISEISNHVSVGKTWNFTLKSEKKSVAPQTKVLGKINLDELNALTRPKKRTKEDYREERDAKSVIIHQNVKGNLQKSHPRHKLEGSRQATIRDIWQKFVDIQEKVIKQRCTPISICPESIEIEDDKLYVTVDESNNEQVLKSLLNEKLGLESYDLSSGSILVDEDKWYGFSEAELEQIRKDLSKCYIELDTTPTINATINYGGKMECGNLLSLDELYQMDSILNNSKLIEGAIDNTVAFISKVSIRREEFMKHLFGDHYTVYEKKKKKQGEIQVVELLEYRNQYIPWNIIQQYASLGLKCKQYKLVFKVNDPVAKEELKEGYDCFCPKTDTFEFCRVFTKKSPCCANYIQEVNENINVFMEEACLYCSKDDIDIDVLFAYTVSRHQTIKSKLQELGQYISTKGVGYSFNPETGSIGIDFNWREQSVEDLLSEIENAVPFITINVHDEHKFKCKINTQIADYDKLKEELENKYEDIDVVNDSISHCINIRLPYVESKFYDIKRASLENDLLQLTVSGFEVHFTEKTEGKVRLNICYNENSRIEDLADSIAEMKKADFGFKLDGQDILFGKLLRANYPDLVFDIDVDDDDKKERIIESFESKAIDTIVPILTGDLEKISRLKNTFTMATTGVELVNPRLQTFIFDSSEATVTPDIELILREDGVVYKDITKHLLNPNVNKSQKDAIIKAMYSEDLAVIQGPPGTGKSTAIAEMIWQLVRRGLQQGNMRERILLTSETNLAVDNAIARIVNDKTNLVKPIRFGDEEKLESEGRQFSIELMKRWVEEGDSCLNEINNNGETETLVHTDLILKNWLHNISERSFYRMHDKENEIVERWRIYLEHPENSLRQIVYKHYLSNINVVGATCSSIGDKRAGESDFNGFTPFYHNYCDTFKQRKGRAKIEFTTVIQDESSKATPAELVLPFVYGQKAIVIGDHRQLPPMLDQEEFEETFEYAYKLASHKEKSEIDKLRHFVRDNFDEMEVSHFQRLYENIDTSLKGTFNLQYRMHPDINEVIEQFYREDGGLYCGLTNPIDLGVNDPNMKNPASRYHGIDIPGLMGINTHVLFVDTDSPEMQDGTSRVNYGEINAIDKILNRFEESGSFNKYLSNFSREEDKQIGIISFYGKQIKHIREMAHEHNKIPIRVSTVDRFQGMERNIIIVSMVRSNVIQSSKDQRPDRNRYPEYGYPRQTSLGFAQSPNRLNVALSRAKRLLIIVGNRQLFSTLEIYQRLFLTIEANPNNKILKQSEL